MNYNCSNSLDIRNLQEQVKKTFCYQKLLWPSASNFISFSRSLEIFFLTVGQNNFGNKIPFSLHKSSLQLNLYVRHYFLQTVSHCLLKLQLKMKAENEGEIKLGRTENKWICRKNCRKNLPTCRFENKKVETEMTCHINLLKENTKKPCKLCTIDPCAKNMTNWKFLLMKSSKKYFIFLSAFYLIMWLMISPKNFEKKAILKIQQLFSSEVSKFTSVWNKPNSSLKYWFIEARLVLSVCYCPKKLSKCHLDTIQTTFSEDNNYNRRNIGENLFLSSLKMHYFRGSLPKWVLTPQKKTSCHIFKMAIFSKFFGDIISHITR